MLSPNSCVKLVLSDSFGSAHLKDKYMSIDYRRIEAYKNILFKNVFDCGGLPIFGKIIASDRDWMLKAVKIKGGILKYGNETLRRDCEIVYEAIKSDRKAISFMDKSLLCNHQLFMRIVKLDGFLLKYADKKLRGDRELVLEAVRNNQRIVDYVTDKALITNDMEIVKYIVTTMNTLEFYNVETDKIHILRLLSNNPSLIVKCNHKDKRWMEIIEEAIPLNPQIFNYLNYLDARLQSDENVVRKYLEAFPNKVLDIDMNLYYNRDFLLSVVKVQPGIVNFFDFQTRNDEEFMKKIIQTNGMAIRYCPEHCNDEELFLMAIEQSKPCFIYDSIGPNLKHNREFHLKIVEVNPFCFSVFPDTFKKDREIALKTISINARVLVSYEYFQDDAEICEALMKADLWFVQYFPNYLKSIKDRKLLLQIIRKYPVIFSSMDSSLTNDLSFVNDCLIENALIYEHLSKSLKNNKEIMKQCIKRENRVIAFIKNTLWSDVDFILDCCGYSHLCCNIKRQ